MDEIKKILEAGIKAPSGSNSQPWKFKIQGTKVIVYADYAKDHPILNYRNRGTLVAHGALLENISIAAPAYGYEARASIFPNHNSPDIIAEIDFVPADKHIPELFEAIPKRSTNRKPYRKHPLTPQQEQALMSTASDFPNLEFKLESDPKNIEQIAEASSVNEVVMLENKNLHKLFFKEITWNEQEDSQRRSGFYLKTLELKPPERIALRMFKNWSAMNFFNKLGAARGIAASNAVGYASSGAVGVIITRDEDSDFLDAGRLMERIWLKATAMGLSFHLVTGILYLEQRILSGDSAGISQEHQRLIKDAYTTIASIFHVEENKRIALLFRVGESDPPSANSKRLDLEKLLVH